MKNLKGTEKQIKYANDLLRKYEENIKKFFLTIERAELLLNIFSEEVIKKFGKEKAETFFEKDRVETEFEEKDFLRFFVETKSKEIARKLNSENSSEIIEVLTKECICFDLYEFRSSRRRQMDIATEKFEEIKERVGVEKVTIKMQGMGFGAGEEVEVLSKKELINIIENTDVAEIARMAIDNTIQGFKNGIAVISMKTGGIYGYSLGQNEDNQACDDQEITLVKVSQNEDIEDLDPEYVELKFDYEEEIEYKYSELVIKEGK